MKFTFLLSFFWLSQAIAAPVIRLVPPASKNTAAFLEIKNTTDKDLKLIGAQSDLSKITELHNMFMENGLMVMRPVKIILIPKGKSVELTRGGLHIMLIGLKKSLSEGQKSKIKLLFENAPTQSFVFEVKNLDSH